MYRKSETYNEIAKIIFDIYMDYDIKSFPIDENEICRKMGIALVPYSSMKEDRFLLLKISKYGFFVPGSMEQVPTIYYNDMLSSRGAMRFTIFHEIKHYVFDDVDDSDDDLADYFARFFMCPTPYLISQNINGIDNIMGTFGLSMEAAGNAQSAVDHRCARYGSKIFDYEKPLINHLVDN